MPDIQAIGSELETADSRALAEFARKHYKHPSVEVRTLASFALFKCSAIGHRLAGRIDEAMLYEGYAETEYQRLPEGARW